MAAGLLLVEGPKIEQNLAETAMHEMQMVRLVSVKHAQGMKAKPCVKNALQNLPEILEQKSIQL